MAKIIDIAGALGAKEFPTTKIQLAQLLHAIAEEMESEGDALEEASTPAEFCTVVHSVAHKLADASEMWTGLSGFIRKHWP